MVGTLTADNRITDEKLFSVMILWKVPPEVNIHECTAAADFCGNFVTVSLRATAASYHHPTSFSFLHQVLYSIYLKSSRIFLGIIFPGSEETQTRFWNPTKFPAELDTEAETAVGSYL